jgi:hypothetical protein
LSATAPSTRCRYEHDARAGREVGGADDDRRPGGALEVRVGRTVEQDLVVEIGGELGTAPALRPKRAPVQWVQSALDEVALHVALEETLLEIIEQLLSIEAVGERSEAAARDPGDQVDLVEQAIAFARARRDLDSAQRFEHAVRERGRRACRHPRTRG